MFTDAVRRFLGRGPEHLTRAQRVAAHRAYQNPGFRGRRQLVRIWSRREDHDKRELADAQILIRDARLDPTITRQQRRRAMLVVAKRVGRSQGRPWRECRADLWASDLRMREAGR